MPKKIFPTLLVAMLFALAGCDGKHQSMPSAEVKRALQGTGSFSGTVRFEGKKPRLRPINMTIDCKGKHTGEVMDETLVLSEDDAVANVFVSIKSGLPAGYYPPHDTDAILEQSGCFYCPRVLAVMVGQKISLRNSDGIFHNVHVYAKINDEQNIGMSGNGQHMTLVFSKEEAMFNIKCDVHPWMVNYLAVLSHPYFAVTDKDGKFSIAKLQPGNYEVEVWHESGDQTVIAPGKQFRFELKQDEQKVQDFAISLKK
jgi:plastocyanin